MSLAFCSWSGGKDCSLALYLAQQQGFEIPSLFTMMVPNIDRSRSHGIRKEILQKQASLMGMAWMSRPATWDSYKEQFQDGVATLASQGMETGIFGDIDNDAHKQWNVDVCASSSIKAIHPLWQQTRERLLDQFLQLGFVARIICVRDGQLDKSFVGREVNTTLLDELKSKGVDLCGENGEYHTLVVDGPLFSRTLDISVGAPELRQGMWVADVLLADDQHTDQTCKSKDSMSRP